MSEPKRASDAPDSLDSDMIRDISGLFLDMCQTISMGGMPVHLIGTALATAVGCFAAAQGLAEHELQACVTAAYRRAMQAVGEMVIPAPGRKSEGN